VLASLFTTAVAAFRVAESQTLNTSGRNLTPAGHQCGLVGKAGTAPAGKAKAPSALWYGSRISACELRLSVFCVVWRVRRTWGSRLVIMCL
jgi:hypothetical protein